MIEGLEVIDHIWYQNVGIVLARNKDTLTECALIGTVDEKGMQIEDDLAKVIRWGYRLDIVKAFAFFHNKLNCSKYADHVDKLWESKDD